MQYSMVKNNEVRKAILRRWVLRRDLKVGKSEQSRMGFSRKFQRVGATMQKALSPQVYILIDT